MKKILSVFAFYILSAYPAYAAPVTLADIEAFLNSVRYINGLDKKEVNLAAIYDAQIAGTQEEASSFANLVGSAKTPDKIKFSGRAVALQDLGRQTDVKVFYLSEKLSPEVTAQIYETAKKQHAFILGKDTACVERAHCILAIHTTPRTEIILSEKALHDLGFEIDPVYKLLIRQK